MKSTAIPESESGSLHPQPMTSYPNPLPVVRIILGFLLFQGISLYAQMPVKPDSVPERIQWYSFEEAYELNKTEPRMIFIDMYTDWCGWCKRMDATTFVHPVIVHYLNTHFYPVKFDAERKDTIVIDGMTFVNEHPGLQRSSHQMAIELLRGKMSYPSYVFLNRKNQLLTVVAGYQPAKELEPILHYFVEDAYLKTQWEEYRPAFHGEID